MAEPARQLGEDLRSRQEEEEAREHWVNRARVRAHGQEDKPVSQNVRQAQSMDSVKSATPANTGIKSLPFKPLTEEEIEDTIAEVHKEGRMARALRKRLEAKRQARAEKYRAAGAEGVADAKGFINRYRQVKTIIRAIKAASAVGTAFGDVFFSIWVLFVSINGERLGEWLLVKFRPQYQTQLAEQKKKDPLRIFDNLLFYGGWLLIIILLLLAAAVIIFLRQKFGDVGGAAALKIIGK